MNSAKIFNVVSLASATKVAAFMALMILRGNMPIIQMALFVGLNGIIVGGLFYIGIDAITSFGAAAQTEPRLALVRNNEGRVLCIESRGPPIDNHGFFGGAEEVIDAKPINERLGLTSRQTLDTIKTVMVIALIMEAYMGVAFISNNWKPLMVVTSRSMEPTLHPGDLIYAKGVAPSKLREGEVITFKPPTKYISGTMITHSIIEVIHETNEITFKTKGDNNPVTDPWTVTASDIMVRQTTVLKALGNYILWMKTPTGLTTLTTALILYLFWPNILETLGGNRNEQR
jgi:signal peptidase